MSENPALSTRCRQFEHVVELEAGEAGVMGVDVRIADVDQSVDRKTGRQLLQMVLVSDEIYGQPMAIPHGALLAHRAVGRASDDVPQGDGVADHFHLDRPRWVTVLQSAVDVEADEHPELTLTDRRVRISRP